TVRAPPFPSWLRSPYSGGGRGLPSQPSPRSSPSTCPSTACWRAVEGRPRRPRESSSTPRITRPVRSPCPSVSSPTGADARDGGTRSLLRVGTRPLEAPRARPAALSAGRLEGGHAAGAGVRHRASGGPVSVRHGPDGAGCELRLPPAL